MFWKKEQSSEEKLGQMNELLKKSFANVKKDTGNIFQWLNHFYRKSTEQEQEIKRLQLEISYMPKTREDIRRIIDEYYSFEGIMAKIRDLNEKVGELEKQKAAQHGALAQAIPAPLPRQDMSHIEKRLEKLEQRKLSMREKIMKRLTRNSKDYVKGMIASYIRKYGRISAMQLKEIIVDEQALCSKSSFYRLLEELEQLDDFGFAKQGKEKFYFSKPVKQV